MRWITLAFLALSTNALSAGIDYPTVGVLSHVTERSGLSFECKELSAARISCDFVQISVSYALSPNDVENTIQRELATMRKNPPNEKDRRALCEMAQVGGDYIAGAKASTQRDPKVQIPFKDRPQKEQKYLNDLIAMASAICKDPSIDNFERLLRFQSEREATTCRISANSFTQTFRRAQEGKEGQIIWINDMPPSGPCGVVQLNRFERKKDQQYLWRYYARKAVTNPTADAILMQCSELDQGEYVYDWSNTERDVGCDLIRFSAY